MAQNRVPPFPVKNPDPGFWECVDAISSKEYGLAIVATLAGTAFGVYAGAFVAVCALPHHAICLCVRARPSILSPRGAGCARGGVRSD